MIPEAAAAKLLGTVAGAVLALVFLPPRTLWGFIRRLIIAVIFGPISAPFIAPHLLTVTRIDQGFDLQVGSAAVGAFCSWWLLGAIHRIAERFGNKEET